MITRIPVVLAITAPFATRSNAPGSFGIDLPLARTADGRRMLPGTHVIGKIAQAMRDLVALLGTPEGDGFAVDLKELFAARAQVAAMELADGREPRRGLSASDFILDTAVSAGRTRTRIARDTATATVADGMLQVIEQPFAPGAPLEFRGELRVFGKLDAERRARLTRVIGFIPQFGGLRTVGFGVTTGVQMLPDVLPGAGLEVAAVLPAAVAASMPKRRRFLMRLAFRDPFCAGEAHNTANTYTSAGYVPGGVIKGAVARQLLAFHGLTGFLDDHAANDRLDPDCAALARAFGSLVVRHAVPVAKARSGDLFRPSVLPDSLAAVEMDKTITIVDLAVQADPDCPLMIEDRVPIGKFDWKPKHAKAAAVTFGPDNLPQRELRIRTEIDPTTRAAKTARLFGIEYTRIDDHDFVAEIEVPSPHDPAAVLRALSVICSNGLAGIGRGGAFAEVTFLPQSRDDAKVTGDTAVLVLQTAALLRDPSDDGYDLRAAYEQSLRDIGLPDNWELPAVFLRERLAGGGFFLNRLAGTMRYAPWLLTEPGATFIFTRKAGTMTGFPESWLAGGLPIPKKVLQFHGLSASAELYRACPYLPQNGYGEVTLGAKTTNGKPSHQVLAPRTLNLLATPITAISGWASS